MSAVSLVNKTSTASLLAGNVGFGTSFEWISSITVGSLGASSVSFTEIPQGYRHLQIRGVVRTAASGQGLYYRMNGDTASNYSSHSLYGQGTGAGAWSSTSAAFMNQYGLAIGTDTTYYAGFVTDILDYSSGVKNKTLRTLSGLDRNGSGEVGLYSGLWMSTAPVSSVVVYPSGSSFAQYSTFSLYGVR